MKEIGSLYQASLVPKVIPEFVDPELLYPMSDGKYLFAIWSDHPEVMLIHNSGRSIKYVLETFYHFKDVRECITAIAIPTNKALNKQSSIKIKKSYKRKSKYSSRNNPGWRFPKGFKSFE